MISKNQVKFIRSLHQKKNRDRERLFFAEGVKVVHELLQSDFNVQEVLVQEDYLDDFQHLTDTVELTPVSEKELGQISALKTPNRILAVAEQKNPIPLDGSDGLTLVFDGIKDPGNMGTILRLADWYGAKHVVCSSDSVEAYNPKVVQASMGSLFRYVPFFTELLPFLKTQRQEEIFLADIAGKSIYETDFPKQSIVVFGSESHGISDNIKQLSNNQITIPSFGKAESLNVSIASAIFCHEYNRGIKK